MGRSCAFEWMPERRLQHHLNNEAPQSTRNVKVFTIGTDGYGQDQQLLVMKEFYRDRRADMVVLWETPLNGSGTTCSRRTGLPTDGRNPMFRLINNQLIGPNENMGDRVRPTNFQLLALVDRVVPIFDRDAEWEKHLPEPYAPVMSYDGHSCDDWQQRYEKDVGYMRKRKSAHREESSGCEFDSGQQADTVRSRADQETPARN